MFGSHSIDKSLLLRDQTPRISNIREGFVAEKSSKGDSGRYKLGSGSTPTAVDLTALKWAQTNAEEGEYFLICKKGKEPRPGVICDEEMVIRYCKLERPVNAKLSDGSYHKHFLPHGTCAGQKAYPFMYIDSLNIGYVPWKLLQPIDFALIAQKQDDPNTKAALKRAYSDVLYEYDLNHWKSALLAKSLDEENLLENSDPMDGANEDGSSSLNYQHKRKRADIKAQVFRFPPTLRALEVEDEKDDDESQYIKREPENGAARYTFSSGVLDQDHGSLYDASDSETRLERTRTKKIRLSKSMSRFTPPATPKKAKAKIGADMVRIFIGNPHRDFIVKRTGLGQSALLRDMIKYQSGEAYIMSPVLADLLPSQFESVAEYLDHGEYKPNLLDEGSDYARLEKVETADQNFEAVIQCGQLYTMSGQLQLPGLQNLVVRKFKALLPYSAEDFLLITKLFYCFGQPSDESLHDFIVNYAVEHFYELWDAASKIFMELLTYHVSLARDIFRKLGGLPKNEEAEEAAIVEAVADGEEEEDDMISLRSDGEVRVKAEAEESLFMN
ncbi:hypothetical protein MMC11_000051 [Xylographa trunciseda]|nr:hypothetical protein [Xylographa trunciseda]